MKIWSFSICLVLLFFACKEKEVNLKPVPQDPLQDIIRIPSAVDTTEDPSALPKLVCDDPVYDFLSAKQGAIIEHTFRFRNEGKKPLLITNVSSTCGCTIPTWPKRLIPPGDSDVIKVTFNTEDKFDFQEKIVTVSANTIPGDTKLIIRGNVTHAKQLK